MNFQDLNSVIKQEADEILYKKGLSDILYLFGTPIVHGSYALDLMAWRDLDIYLQAEHLSLTEFFQLGEKICGSFSPVKMSFRNELKAKTGGLPEGLYWGIYLGNERIDAWKIDIWALPFEECQRRLKFCNDIKEKLTPSSAQKILEIKSLTWRDPEFRRSYDSADIYNAVLENHVEGIEAFKAYLQRINKPG